MNNRTKELTMIGVIVAMMAALSPFSIPLGGLPAITMQTLFVFLAGLLLKPSNAFLAMIVYIVLGIIGIPIFAGGGSGLGYLVGPTGGFILAFPIAAYLTSLLKNIKILNNQFMDQIVILFSINLIIYMIGGAYFMYVQKWTLSATVLLFGTYLPGDIIKILVAIYVARNIRKVYTYEHS